MIRKVIEDLGGGIVVEQEVAVVERVLENEVTRSLVKDISILPVAPEANLKVLPELADLAQEVVPETEIEDVGVNLILVVILDLNQDLGIEVESIRNLKESTEKEVQVLVLSVVASIQNHALLKIVKTEKEEEVVIGKVGIKTGEVVTEKAEIVGVVTEKVETVEVVTKKVEIEEVKIGLAVNVTGEVKIAVKFVKRKGSYHQLRMKMKPIKLL